jgi:hypothetical protein
MKRIEIVMPVQKERKSGADLVLAHYFHSGGERKSVAGATDKTRIL